MLTLWRILLKYIKVFTMVLMPIVKFKTWWDSSQQVCTLLFDNAGFVICQLSFLHREQIHELHYWYNRAFNYHFLMLDLLTAMPWFVLTASLHCRKVHPGWSNIMKRFKVYFNTKFAAIIKVYRLYKNCLQNNRQKVWLEI